MLELINLNKNSLSLSLSSMMMTRDELCGAVGVVVCILCYEREKRKNFGPRERKRGSLYERQKEAWSKLEREYILKVN